MKYNITRQGETEEGKTLFRWDLQIITKSMQNS